MSTTTVLLIGGVAIVAVLLLTQHSQPIATPYVPVAGNESEMAAGANAVASVINQSMKIFGSSMAANGMGF